ncbi:3-keto-5-aminohexanoate cleavage protein [Salinivibrio socompensis]|uniref:3-keto-5-aminohexanoate cleavage protein n=1 Tax=Salinivibrio socompensis TaxID=1510206 RepID=UPI00046ED73F|nr:3-keto-5-aminohexanoate cleavage protein [Salinivibrio socompensis]
MLDARTIMVAPNGAHLQPTHHPRVPVTGEQLIHCLQACAEAGATMAHIHARDEQGAHSLDPIINQRLYQQVQDAVGDRMVIQLTTEAVGRYSPLQQMALIKVIKPEAASFALRELIPDHQPPSKAVRDFFAWTVEARIYSQFILYHPSELARYYTLREQGILPSQGHHLLFVAGRDRTPPRGTSEDVVVMYHALHADNTIPWSVCAFGCDESRCVTTAALLGGDVRIGFENNTQHIDHSQALDNASQITNLRNTLENLGYCTKPVQALRQTMTQSF